MLAHATVTVTMRTRSGTYIHSDTKTTLEDASHATSAAQYGTSSSVRSHAVLGGQLTSPRKLT